MSEEEDITRLLALLKQKDLLAKLNVEQLTQAATMVAAAKTAAAKLAPDPPRPNQILPFFSEKPANEMLSFSISSGVEGSLPRKIWQLDAAFDFEPASPSALNGIKPNFEKLADELVSGEGDNKTFKRDTLKAYAGVEADEFMLDQFIALADVKLSKKAGILMGEMFYQQMVYPPITALMKLFGEDLYRADQEICAAHALNQTAGASNVAGSVAVKALCKPDGAIALSTNFYLLAALEIKPEIESTKHDRGKCALVTAMSAYAMMEYAAGENEINLPFLVGGGYLVELCMAKVTRNKTGGNHDVNLWLVKSVNLLNHSHKMDLLARLVVMLSRAREIGEAVTMTAAERYWQVGFDRVKRSDNLFAASSTRSRRPKRDSSANHPAGAPPSGGQTTLDIQKAAVAERCAIRVAAMNGQVTSLEYPWLPLHDSYFCNGKGLWRCAYQLASPYYFYGKLTEGGKPVFLKVWRDGDAKTSRQVIETELRCLKQANKIGVASPKVFLSGFSMHIHSCKSATDNHCALLDDDDAVVPHSLFHAIVMEKLTCDEITDPMDLPLYAYSLSSAVEKLHQHGILHCDIKPNNVCWDAREKVASLVDFGHAQDETGATSYRATDGYEAPEVVEGRPHSRASDAFGVGKTIQKQLEKLGQQRRGKAPALDVVFDVAQALTHDDVEQRLDLKVALERLCKGDSGSPPTKKHKPVDAVLLKRPVSRRSAKIVSN